MSNDYKVTVSGLSDGTLERAIADIQGRLTGLQKAASGIQIGGGVYQGTAGSPAFAPTVPSGSAAGVAQASAQTGTPLTGPPMPPSVSTPSYAPPVSGPGYVPNFVFGDAARAGASGQGAAGVAGASAGYSARGLYPSSTYRDYQSAQQVGFQGGYPDFLADRHEQKLGRQQAQAERENERRDERLQKQQDARDRKHAYDVDAAQVAADKAHDRMMQSRYTAQNASVGKAFGFADMNDTDIPRHVQNVMGGNAFSKYDPDLYNTSMLINGKDPAMAAGLAGLRARAAIQGVFNKNVVNDAYTRGQQRYLGQAGVAFANQALGGGMSLWANNAASGELDIMGAAGYHGGVVGSAVGMITGAITGAMAPVPEPGLGALLGQQLGQSTGSAAAQMFMAPFLATRNAVSSLAGVSNRFHFDPYQLAGAAGYTNVNFNDRTSQQTHGLVPGGLAAMAERISSQNKSPRELALLKLGLYSGTDTISLPQISNVFSSFASAELNNGRNDLDTTMGLTGRFASRYGINAPRLSATAAGVLAKSASLGDNQGDLMLQGGPEAYGLFADATGNRDFSPRQLTSYGNIQRDHNAIDRASTLASGVGSARERAGRNLLHDLAPFGRDSLAYLTAEQEQRGNRLQAFEEQGMATTGLEAVRLSGQRDRFAMLPYAPGNIIGNQIATSRNAGMEAARIGKYMQSHKGDLSEEQTLQMEQRRQGQLTESWQAAAMLSEGMTNRLPALSSNAPAGIGVQRFSSWTLAAKNADMMGLPSREWGANNGAHLARQNALFANLGGTAAMSNATSTTAGFNTSGETNSLLREIAGILRGLGGGLGGGGSSGRMTGYAGGSGAQRIDNPAAMMANSPFLSERLNNLEGQLSRYRDNSARLYNSGTN